MALSLRKTSERGSVGLDIDGRYLAAAQVDGTRLVRSASHNLPEGVVNDGEVIDTAALSDALKRFVADEGLPKNVRLGVANQQIVVRVIELPRIEDEKQREAAVRFQAAEAIAMPLNEAILDHQVAGLRRGGRRHAADAGRARGGPPLDGRVAARGRQGRRAQGRGRRPRRVRPRAHARQRRRRRRRVGPRLLPPRRSHQPCDRRRIGVLLHPAALGGLGRAGRRLAPGRRGAPLDRLLHDPAPGTACGRGGPVRTRVGRRAARGEPRRAPRPARSGGLAARRPRHLEPRAGRGSRIATPWRRDSRSERRHEARQPSSPGASGGAPPAGAPAAPTWSSACSARSS